jgi:hypothetical protein
VDIADDLDRRLELEQDRLRDEDLARLQTEAANLRFCQVDSLARALATNLPAAEADEAGAQ